MAARTTGVFFMMCCVANVSKYQVTTEGRRLRAFYVSSDSDRRTGAVEKEPDQDERRRQGVVLCFRGLSPTSVVRGWIDSPGG